MNKVLVLIAVLVLGGGGAYALVKNNNNDNKPRTSTATSSSDEHMDIPKDESSKSDSAGEAAVATNTVEISNFAYTPANITIKKGTTVTWTNQDAIKHDIKETDGKDGPKSELLAKGESFNFTYNTAGSFKYSCSVHPQMSGTVIVTE